ncbi:MAG: hypothetical protein ACRCTK_01000 [Alphaproteobacteria bacterium]
MKTSILTLAAILGISQGYAAGGQQAGDTLLGKKSSEEKRFSHPDFRQSERGDPSEYRVWEHSTELKNKLEPHKLPENFSEFEKLEEATQKHNEKSYYDSSKEDRGDPLRGAWIDGENEEDSLRKSGIFDRETGQKAPQDAPQILNAHEAAISPPTLPETPAPQKPEETSPPLKKPSEMRENGLFYLIQR